MKYGPVDVVVLATGEPKFDGSVLAELQKLAAAGTIRVLDAMVLVKADDDVVVTMDIEDLPQADKDSLAFIETGTRGLFNGEDAATLSEGLVPGSAVVALAIENTWAVGLINSFEAAGAEIAAVTRIPAVVMDEMLSALENA